MQKLFKSNDFFRGEMYDVGKVKRAERSGLP